MAKRVFAYKLHVNDVLRNYPEKKINVYNLIDNRKEYIPDVFLYLIELFEKLNENNKEKYICKILIAINDFYDCFRANNLTFNENMVKKLYLLEDDYKYFLNKTGSKSNDNVLKILEEIKEKLKKDYPKQEEEKENNDNSYLLERQIKEKEEEIKNLSVKITALEEQNENLKKDLIKKSENMSNLKKKNKELQDQASQINKGLKEELQQLEQLKEENININNELHNEKVKNIFISQKLEENINKNNEYHTLLEEKRRKEEQERTSEIRQNKLDKQVITKLICGEYTISKLCGELWNDGFNYSLTEVKESLRRVKNKINITNPKQISVDPVYHTYKPYVVKNAEFSINSNKDYYDVLLTADWHLGKIQDPDAIMYKVDKIYDYCSKNSIDLVLNLGDLFHVGQNEDVDIYNENMALIEQLIKIFPKDKLIRHAILGGNHEKRMFKVGIDPIKTLTDSREDLISLGYDNAIIKFNDNEKIGLHHPGFYDIQMADLSSRTKIIVDYLKDYYKSIDMKRKDIYIDLFGHFHTAYLSNTNSFAFVPSFTQIRSIMTNSAWHLKIYFNEEKQIDYILIKSLSSLKTLKPIMDTVYTKRR